jgi:hypothetical protein
MHQTLANEYRGQNAERIERPECGNKVHEQPNFGRTE